MVLTAASQTNDGKVLILHKDDKADVLADVVPANLLKIMALLKILGTRSHVLFLKSF